MPSNSFPADLPFLAALARSARPADQLLWLRIATDCFLNEPPQRAVEFAPAVIDGLASVDEATRSAVARKLAPCEAAADVLASLESLGGEAWIHALQHAVALPRERLIVAAAGDNARARAVARREDLDGELVDILAEHDEIEVLIALARNRRAPIDARLFAALARQANQRLVDALDRRLAEALLARAPVGLEHAALFLVADSGRRAEIMIAAQRAALGAPRNPQARRDASGAIARLERFALEADAERFVGVLAEALACAPDLARRIARDASGEPLAVALAALGAADDVTVRILTSCDIEDGGDYRRVGALARLKGTLDPAAARLVAAAMIGEAPRPHARRLPVLDADAAPTPSRPSGARAAPPVSLGANTLTPAALRRRRAFAFAAGRPLAEGER